MSIYEILIRNAQLLGAPGKRKSIAVAGGKIVAVAERIEGQASIEIDAKGMLVSESFVNPHLHLCKVYTLQMMDEKALRDYHAAEMGKAMTAIELAARVKDNYDESWIIKNVRRAVAQAALFGCTHLRAFASVSRDGEPRTSKRNYTAVATLFTFWPPDPAARTNSSWISLSSRAREGVIAIMGQVYQLASGIQRPHGPATRAG